MKNDKWKILKKSLIIVLLIGLAFSFPQPAKSNASWLDSTWQYRRPLIIDNSPNNLPLKNYILKINLDNTNFDFYKANPSGYDLRFTLDDGLTLLDHELEYYNYPKSARIKIKIPYAPAKINTLLYLYYGAKISVANIAKEVQGDGSVPTEEYLNIFDEGEYRAPSNWKITGSGYNADISQTSNIFTYDAPSMSGTYALLKNLKFTAGDLDFEMMSEDDDGLGIIFGSKDKNNYYRLSWFKQGLKVLTDLPGDILGSGLFLQIKQNGKWTRLSRDNTIFEQNKWHKLKIKLDEQNIKIYIDSKKIFDVANNAFRGAWVGLYSWANQGAHFRGLLNVSGYENPDLYLPISYQLGEEETFTAFYSNLYKNSKSIITRLANYQDILPDRVYTLNDSKPLIAGLVAYYHNVKLFIDAQFIADIASKEGEKSTTANWYYQLQEELDAGEHLAYTIPYEITSKVDLASSPKIKFIIPSAPKTEIRPFGAPTIIGLGENRKVDMKRIYFTASRQPTITGLAPYGWPVRLYIDNQLIGNATVQGGELSGTANWYLKPLLSPGRHTLVAVTYNQETNEESRSPQVITFEVR